MAVWGDGLGCFVAVILVSVVVVAMLLLVVQWWWYGWFVCIGVAVVHIGSFNDIHGM